MDETAAALFNRLIEKTFEDMSQEDRLEFVERLFQDLPPKGQQEFLLNLSLQTAGVDRLWSRRHPGRGPGGGRMVKMGPESFGPWQMCCRAMNDFVDMRASEPVETANMARMFTGLADATRLKIVKLLSEGERSVDELVGLLGIAQSTTSHHLRVLKDAGLVRGEKRGRSVFYSLVIPLEEEELS